LIRAAGALPEPAFHVAGVRQAMLDIADVFPSTTKAASSLTEASWLCPQANPISTGILEQFGEQALYGDGS
jgi:hypothetical protein